jgi:hypothetical protein
MSRLALIAILVIVAIGVTLQYFADDLRGLLDIQKSSQPPPEQTDGPPQRVEPRPDHPGPEDGAKVAEVPVETEPVPPSERELVRSLVERRYPMPELPPFKAIVGDWSQLPTGIYPARVVVSVPVDLTEETSAGLVARAHVAAGGAVRPIALEGDRLSVQSLARAQLTASIPVADTDFKKAIEARYHEALGRARLRVAAQREADSEWLNERVHVVRRLERKQQLWDDLDDSRFVALRESVSAGRAGAVRIHDLDRVFYRGPETHYEAGFEGQLDTVLVTFQVNDAGFGKLPYYSKCLMRRSSVVGWLNPVPEWDRAAR